MGHISDPVEYLSDLSPQDKPWDGHKWQSQLLAKLYQGTTYTRLSERVQQCSGVLDFCWVVTDKDTGECKLKLKACRFCRVRLCPICQWRRSLMWIARFLKALPQIQAEYPTARWIFITLTVRNCDLVDLRSTVDNMNRAWKRLSLRKQFPLIGFARSLEVTRAEDGKAHPHFHVLGMVRSSYFSGKSYVKQKEWTELWKKCLRIDYTPIVHIETVKPNKKAIQDVVVSSLAETFKYTVKSSDLLGDGDDSDREWLVTLTGQLHKTRAITLGGVLKNYLSEAEPEDLISEDLEPTDLESSQHLLFGWREHARRYGRKRSVPTE